MRKMMWVLILWCALIIVWIATGANSAQKNCHATSKLGQQACDAGTGIGVAIILLVGFVGFVFLSIVWFMTRPRQTVYAVPPPPSQQAQPAPSAQPANWYPDPQTPGTMRYWDGQRWTEHTASGY